MQNSEVCGSDSRKHAILQLSFLSLQFLSGLISVYSTRHPGFFFLRISVTHWISWSTKLLGLSTFSLSIYVCKNKAMEDSKQSKRMTDKITCTRRENVWKTNFSDFHTRPAAWSNLASYKIWERLFIFNWRINGLNWSIKIRLRANEHHYHWTKSPMLRYKLKYTWKIKSLQKVLWIFSNHLLTWLNFDLYQSS